MPKLTNEQKNELIEERKSGVSIGYLAKKYGISYGYASQLTSGAILKSKTSYEEEKRKAWRELYALACHIKKLAGR